MNIDYSALLGIFYNNNNNQPIEHEFYYVASKTATHF